MVVPGHDPVVFYPIEFAPGNFVQLCGLTFLVGLEEEVIVRKVIIPAKVSGRDHPGTARVCHRPGAKAGQKDENANDRVDVGQPGAAEEQPRVQIGKDDEPATTDQREVRQYQYPVREMFQNAHGLVSANAVEAIPGHMGKSHLHEIRDFAVVGIRCQAIIDNENAGNGVQDQNRNSEGPG